MKTKIILLLLFFFALPILGQKGFQFEKGIDKVVIPFKFINNLIFIPLKVNGVELNFLLDSGVEETILFGLDDKKEVSFFNVEKIELKGLGSESSVEGLKSTNNTLEINGYKSTNHLFYVVLDQTFNLSSHIGIPVNGIIGFTFLKNNLLEINYNRKRITVFKDTQKHKKRIEKKFEVIPISIEKSKPYLNGSVVVDSDEIPVKLLIDIGNGDALWLFDNESKDIKVPNKNFLDYLGKGFSGDIEGKRAQIKKFIFSKFEFKKPIVAFPDSISIKHVKMVENRSGSIGSEIMKRFLVVFDYENSILYLKKNRGFASEFSYNKSGIEIQHNGLQWVSEDNAFSTSPNSGITFDGEGNKISNNVKYKFVLKPIYEISNVRKGSPAALNGLQNGDIILRINKEKTYHSSLQDIYKLLRSEDERWITLEIQRGEEIKIIRFQLLNVL